jgi:biopolymer transport protein ExbD
MARTFRRPAGLSAVDEINVTPLIDLAFALLIIFMIAAPLLEQTIPIDLPEESVSPQPSAQPEAQVISIDADRQLFWASDPIDAAELGRRLATLASLGDPPVLHVRGDASLPYQEIITVVDAVKSAGLTKLSLDTQSGSP